MKTTDHIRETRLLSCITCGQMKNLVSRTYTYLLECSGRKEQVSYLTVAVSPESSRRRGFCVDRCSVDYETSASPWQQWRVC